MPTRLFALTLLAWTPTACSSSGTEAEVELVAEGSGPTNVEPLMPMRVGTRYIYETDGRLTNGVVAAAPSVDGHTGRRVEWANGEVTWWRHAGAGWELWGGNNGPLDEPVMVMPDTLRVGMQWESVGNRFEVRRRKTELTPWGPLPVWSIHHTLEEFGVLRDIDYVEGRGAWRETGTDPGTLHASFVPLDEQETVDPDAPMQALQPILDPLDEHLVLGLEGSPVFAIEPRPGITVVGVRGQSWAFLRGSWTLIWTNVCLRVEDGRAQEIEVSRAAGTFHIDDHGACFAGLTEEPGDPPMTHHRFPWVSPEASRLVTGQRLSRASAPPGCWATTAASLA